MSGWIRIPAESLAVLEDMYADAKACRSPDAEGSPPGADDLDRTARYLALMLEIRASAAHAAADDMRAQLEHRLNAFIERTAPM